MTATPTGHPLAEATSSDRARRQAAARLTRYGAASAAPTAAGVAVLTALVVIGVAPAWANVAASLAGTAVWSRAARRRPAAPGPGCGPRGPWWVMPVTGLVLSTLAVHVVAGVAATWSPVGRAAAADLACLASYGALRLAAFALLEEAARATERPGGGAVG